MHNACRHLAHSAHFRSLDQQGLPLLDLPAHIVERGSKPLEFIIADDFDLVSEFSPGDMFRGLPQGIHRHHRPTDLLDA